MTAKLAPQLVFSRHINRHRVEEAQKLRAQGLITGLPMTVWAYPRDVARHVKIKVHRRPRMRADIPPRVGLRPLPHVVAGDRRPADQRAVFRGHA